MSIPSEKVAPLIDASVQPLAAGAAPGAIAAEEIVAVPEIPITIRRKRQRPYTPRVSTKLIWYLGDIVDRTEHAQLTMRKVLEWLREQRMIDAGDDARLARLGQLDHLFFDLALDVSESERIATRAKSEARPASDEKGTPEKS